MNRFNTNRPRGTCSVVIAMALAVGCGKAEMMNNDPPGARSIRVAITGEEAATEGLVFNPMPKDGDIVFLDGWTVKFDRWLVSVGSVGLNQPGTDPGQQQKVGALVAQQKGPWIVDVTKPSSNEETELLTFDKGSDGKAFDTQVRYAFSFDLSPATQGAKKLNVASSDSALVDRMIQMGYSNYVEGVATHEPDSSTAFKDYPTTVKFSFGWGGTVSYINCSNPRNGNEEEKNRGVQPKQDKAEPAAITLHLEHLFWDKLNVENPPLRFDPVAARAKMGAVSMEDLKGSMVTNLTDTKGNGVQDRGQLPGYMKKMGTLSYDPNGTPGITSLDTFMVYSAQSMAHLNGEGLCYVSRK